MVGAHGLAPVLEELLDEHGLGLALLLGTSLRQLTRP